MSFDQGQFNFDARGPEEGYERWREELDEKRKAFEKRWGVILSRRVEIVLNDHEKPLRGILRLVRGKKSNPNKPPEFEINRIRFQRSAIVSIIQLNED